MWHAVILRLGVEHGAVDQVRSPAFWLMWWLSRLGRIQVHSLYHQTLWSQHTILDSAQDFPGGTMVWTLYLRWNRVALRLRGNVLIFQLNPVLCGPPRSPLTASRVVFD